MSIQIKSLSLHHVKQINDVSIMKVTIEFEDCKQLMNFTEVIKFLFGLGISCHFSDRFEDAGGGMYNFELPLGIVLKCYPFSNEGNFFIVRNWECDEHEDLCLADFPLILQKNIITELADAVHGDLKDTLTFTDDGKVSFTKVSYTLYTSTLKDIIKFVNEHEDMFKRLEVEF